MQTRNLVMFVVAMAGLAGGVIFPGPSSVFYPYVLYMMMAIMLLSFLRLELAQVSRLRAVDLAEVLTLSGLKLVAVPLACWAVARVFWPEQALAVLLLSGVSSGVTGPFFAARLGADVNRVLQVTVLTSILVPLTLPALVKVVRGAELTIPFWHMARLLLLVIFVPLGLALLGRRFTPRLVDLIDRAQYPIALALFFVVNLGVFSVHGSKLVDEGQAVLWAAVGASVLGTIYAGVGLLYGIVRGRRRDMLTGATSLGFINNLLVIVFAAKFFGDQGPLLAAMYMIPFFGLLIPLGWLGNRTTAPQ